MLYTNTCIHKILQFSVEKYCNGKRYGIKWVSNKF